MDMCIEGVKLEKGISLSVLYVKITIQMYL